MQGEIGGTGALHLFIVARAATSAKRIIGLWIRFIHPDQQSVRNSGPLTSRPGDSL